MMSESAIQDYCDCLRRIAILLEKGEPIAAAAVVAEMNEIFPRLPAEIREEELQEAQGLLERCKELEQGLRHKVLASLQQLAATRRSRIYQWGGHSP